MKNRCSRKREQRKKREEIIKEIIKDYFSEKKDMHFQTESVYQALCIADEKKPK